MTAHTWYADIDVIATRAVTLTEAETIAESLADYAGAVSVSRDGMTAALSIALSAADIEEASRTATRIAVEAFGGSDRLEVVKLDVRTEEVMQEELEKPSIPDLVGYAEIAEMAGVSRQRARQFADIAGFPVSVVDTAAGPLRLRASVEAWLENRNTRPGRRPANA